ncbi:hypothetical protein EYF80_046407 [Liparis tanakae]|uniref:Uncharacterized protein n=1 Tax=Liparis tanakae TaxID=230148 RepID=A0A4Z2FRJ1_9TELE|nr:hypothetical protein EYF80_046407 [Liparis tanakae]
MEGQRVLRQKVFKEEPAIVFLAPALLFWSDHVTCDPPPGSSHRAQRLLGEEPCKREQEVLGAVASGLFITQMCRHSSRKKVEPGGAEGHRSSMSHTAEAANGIRQEAQGSQSDQAGGPRQPMGSSRRPKAANGIKKEAQGSQ